MSVKIKHLVGEWLDHRQQTCVRFDDVADYPDWKLLWPARTGPYICAIAVAPPTTEFANVLFALVRDVDGDD